MDLAIHFLKLSRPRIIVDGTKIPTRRERLWTNLYVPETKRSDCKKGCFKSVQTFPVFRLKRSFIEAFGTKNTKRKDSCHWTECFRWTQPYCYGCCFNFRLTKIHRHWKFDGWYKHLSGGVYESFWNFQGWRNQYPRSWRWCGVQRKRQFWRNQHDTFIWFKIWRRILHQWMDEKKRHVWSHVENAQWLWTIVEWQIWRFMFGIHFNVSGQHQ